MTRPRTFPSEVYMTIENQGSDNEFYDPKLSLEECGDLGEQVRVGRYMLHKVITIDTKIVVKKSAPR